ncbi:Gfo/Idh/MocA family protein [Arthrobacter sp. N199823]|uniref:Gfo/Idh/MocA family protein n=1 Tax=Arthrobacter sp. N199823 TaxID=2058895 RepID=UPI000CE309D7|nr:Gfo/Idh/MocA family oxidoreductase [Arthrobacter sp. N199823]
MEQLRVGLIGAGGIAGVHIAGWQQLGAHVSVYSRSGAAHLVQEFGVAEAESLDALLADCDLVSILTPTTTHHEYAMAAIAAGKDVMCEKPLAETTARAAEIANAAKSAGVRLFPAHVVRFFPEYVAAKAQLEQGLLGSPQVLRLSRASAAPAAGSWFFDEEAAGGIIRDQMIHDLDQALWLAGDVIQVEALQAPSTVDGVVPRPVTAKVFLTHESGAVSFLRGEWGPDNMPFHTSIAVEGDAGMWRFPLPLAADLGAATDGGPADGGGSAPVGGQLPEQSPASSPYTLQIAEFAQACSTAAPSRVSPYDGVMAVALAEAAYASIASGGPVEFSAASVAKLLD